MKLDNRIKELIAIGASITANCQPCLQYHLEKAREYGADEQEIREAIAVGKTVRKGAAVKMDAFTASCHPVNTAAENSSGSPGCGCAL